MRGEEDITTKTVETPEMKVFTSGAKSTVKKPSYHLVPQITVELIAERHDYGAGRHGAWNYTKGADDPEFVTDRCNHLVEHALNFARYRRRSDLAAILCNGSILAEIRAFIDDEVLAQREAEGLPVPGKVQP